MKAELWIKVVFPGRGRIGPGKVELLRRIGDHGSISAAARAMGMSYRRAWLLVDETNRLFDEPVVETWHGGRSQGGAALTALGRRVVEQYELLVERCGHAASPALEELAERTGGPQETDPGSH